MVIYSSTTITEMRGQYIQDDFKSCGKNVKTGRGDLNKHITNWNVYGEGNDALSR